MTITRLWYHPQRRRDQPGPVADLPDGVDLLTLFDSFVKGIHPDKLVRNDTQSYTSLLRPPRVQNRALIMATESGRFGEKGNVKDVITHKSTGEYGENEATAVVTHGVLLVPKPGTSALAFVERSGGQGGMTRLLDLFEVYFRARYPKHVLERESIVERDAWVDRANLIKVRATARTQMTDPGSGKTDTVVGNIVHTIEPAGGASATLPRWLWRRLRDNKMDRAKYLGLASNVDVEQLDLDITLQADGRTKTFEINTEKTPNLSLVLTTTGESAFDEEKVVNKALNEAASIFADLGIDWSEADALDKPTQQS